MKRKISIPFGSLLVLALCLISAATLFANKKSHPPTISGTTIPASLFGMHVNSSGSALPPTGWFGQQRLWDTQTNWYQIETNAPLTITNIQRSGGTSTITVSTSTSGWSVNDYVYVTGVSNNSFNGLYQITGVTTTSPYTISYAQNLGSVMSTSASGSANYFVFSALDTRLQNAKSQGLEVMFTFGKVPSFYSSNTGSGLCSPNPDGSCFPPTDLASDGTGLNKHWRLFVTALAQHVSGLSTSTYAIPGYFETWNEANSTGMWQGANAQLVRLMDDAACILKGTGTITALSVSCSSASGFLVKGVLTSAKVLQPCVSTPSAVTFWNSYYGTAGATDNADIIGVHTYGYGDHIQSIGATALTRSDAHTVTVTATAHGFAANTVLLIANASPSSFNGTVTVKTSSANSFTYLQDGTNGQTGGGGTMQNGPDQLQQAISTFVAGLSTTDKAKALWVTEGQWGLNNATSDPDTQEGYAPRWYAILWSAGVARANWYGWDFTNGSGVMWESTFHTGDDKCDGTGTPSYTCNPATGYVNKNGQVFKIERDWMYNNKMSTLCANSGTIWTCTFTKPDTTTELMVWDSAQDKFTSTTPTTSNYATPAGYTAYYDAFGTKTTGLITGQNVAIGTKPILFVP